MPDAPPTTSPPTTPIIPTIFDRKIESLLIQTAVGITVGAAVGTALFSRGKGYRVGAMAMGAGVAAGRAMEGWNDNNIHKA